ncbi:MAG: MotA/TolQ/ExbB proton channel family protein [Myxococcales bacterium]|nr:MotA/TolQ/ExbB proton channel family protein [Myxococcales bacterium]
MSTVESIKQLVLSAGAGWVLWLLAGLSVLALTIAIERFLYLRSRRSDLRGLAERVGEKLDAEDYDGARAELEHSRAVAASVAAAGLKLAHLGPTAAEKAMDSARALERREMEKRLAFLGTLGNNAPFVGLLGTVIGVIHAFEELGHAAPGHAAPGGAASEVVSQSVMTGIAEALVATAVGIAVALPAVAAYNAFQRRISSLLSSTDVLSKLVTAYLAGHHERRRSGTAEE